MNPVDIVVRTRFEFEISFWQAVKLRIAGPNFRPIAEKILEEMVNKLQLTKEK
jgi:hypothetical protein